MQESKSEFAERRWQYYALRDAGIGNCDFTLLVGCNRSALWHHCWHRTWHVSYLFHRWAHLLAAMRRKVSVVFATRWYAIFLFNMRIGEVSEEAFFEISFAGFFATLLYLIFSVATFQRPSYCAACATFSRVDALIFEAPIAIWAMVADDVPAGDIRFLTILLSLERTLAGQGCGSMLTSWLDD